ncbi:MAG TPA: hypothetical protein P5204_06005 [Kiritimatiellia bacterium]|nr:hypothetical protein [Kiritimatiellia bacterium]
MKPQMTKRSVRIFLAVLLGLVLAGFALTACTGTEGSCTRACPQCEYSCGKASGHSGQHECGFCGWHWY